MSGLRKDLWASSADGAAASVMVGIGETYLPAFVLALSGSQLACGLVSTVPLVAGAMLQLASPYALARLRCYRQWVVFCAVVQGLAFVPLLAAALAGAMPLALVFGSVTVYWGAGLASGPAWNAWLDTLVPGRVRTRYFARRTGLCQLGVVVGFVVGGLSLQSGAKLGAPLAAFAVLFSAAALSRLLSAHFLHRQREPSPPDGDSLSSSLAGALGFLRRGNTARVLAYLLVAQTAVQISGPYFNPYMLRHLGLSYASYVILICTAYVSKIACLPAMGRVADRFGANRLLWIGAVAIIPVSGLWYLSEGFGYLCAVQVLSGVAWGAYELAMLLLFFEAIPGPERVGVLTIFNLANSTAILVGSLLGGALLSALGATRDAYLTLFVVSSIGRAAAVPLLGRMPRVTIQSLVAVARSALVRPRLPGAREVGRISKSVQIRPTEHPEETAVSRA